MAENKDKGKNPATGGDTSQTGDPRKQQQKKTILAALVLLVPFCLAMYFIFGGSNAQEEVPGGSGINLSVPDGRSSGIEATKQKALERVQAERQQQENTLSFDGNAFSLLDEAPPQTADKETSIGRSRQAYREATLQMNDFYNSSRSNNAEVEELKKQVAELSAQLEQQSPPQVPDPVELAEKQYALAAKYFGTGVRDEGASRQLSASVTGKNEALAVRGVADNPVSTLSAPLPDSLLMRKLGRERNLGFNTAVGGTPAATHKGIRVCVDEDQTLSSGDRIRLRLLESMYAGGIMIPAGTVLFGHSGIAGQRMKVVVTEVEYRGDIIPVELTAHDLDGAEGLYVPDSQERTAAKEAAASIGSGLGTSISFTRSAGQQVAMDLVRGVMTGGTQYLASKLREVKVSVKSGYQLLLISKE